MRNLEKAWPFGLDRRTWPWFAGGFALLLLAVSFGDVAISRFVVAWPDYIRGPFHELTRYGESDWVLFPALRAIMFFGGLSLLLRGVERLAFIQLTSISAFVFLGVALPGLFANLLKRLIGRARPLVADADIGSLTFHNWSNDWQFQSFPSGHNVNSFAMAMVLGFFVPRLYPWAIGVAVLIGFSRISENMHYPTDVLGGFVVGTLGAFAVRNVFASRRWLFERRADGTIGRRPLSAIKRVFSLRRPRLSPPRYNAPAQPPYLP